jgi:hypothetical protein
MESVDLSIPRPSMGGGEGEFHNTRNFTYFARVVRNVRRINNVYSRIKKKREWGIDPDFVQLNPSFESWMKDLPADLQITFPPDGSPPWLPSHFIGNLHSYYYLGIIMLHRPQFTFMEPTNIDGCWKDHIMICYSSAKLLCRLQEAILQSFGMTGLLYMQRGIDFTIYCVLTCTVLHLVCTVRGLVVSFCKAKHQIGRTQFTRSRSQFRRSRILHSAHDNTREMF